MHKSLCSCNRNKSSTDESGLLPYLGGAGEFAFTRAPSLCVFYGAAFAGPNPNSKFCSSPRWQGLKDGKCPKPGLTFSLKVFALMSPPTLVTCCCSPAQSTWLFWSAVPVLSTFRRWARHAVGLSGKMLRRFPVSQAVFCT